MSLAPRFWQHRPLAQLTAEEWEALCDGCGRCCLHKLEDEDTGELYYTEVACRLLDLWSCRCGDYAGRCVEVADCVALTPGLLPEIDWLPSTCAYRRVAAGHDLDWWHPLVSGSADTVHEAGISVRGRAISEELVPPEEWEDHLVSWVSNR